MSTAQKLAAWLEVLVSTLVDLGGSGTDALAAQIAAVLHQEPRLAEIFSQGHRTLQALSRLRAARFKFGHWPGRVVDDRLNIDNTTPI